MSQVLLQNTLNDVSELPEVAKSIAVHLQFPTIVLFHGDLGAGKTTLIRQLVQVLGARVEEEVASPTFALHRAYETQRGPIDHWDLYRLEEEDQLESSGFWDQFLEMDSLILIEWPERLKREWLPKNIPTFDLNVEIKAGDARQITLLKEEQNPA